MTHERLETLSLMPVQPGERVVDQLTPDEIAEYTVIAQLLQLERETFTKVSRDVLEAGAGRQTIAMRGQIRMSLDLSDLAERRLYRFLQDAMRARGKMYAPSDIDIRLGWHLVVLNGCDVDEEEEGEVS